MFVALFVPAIVHAAIVVAQSTPAPLTSDPTTGIGLLGGVGNILVAFPLIGLLVTAMIVVKPAFVILRKTLSLAR